MTAPDGKPHCHECKWRHAIPGDAHSRCGYPGVHDLLSRAMLAQFMTAPVSQDWLNLCVKCGITINPHGFKNGRPYWPFNYDPIWLESCSVFESKEDGTCASSGGVT